MARPALASALSGTVRSSDWARRFGVGAQHRCARCPSVVRCPGAMPVDLRRYPVLFVDDEAPTRATFRYAHEDRFAVLTAGSGAEAIAILRREPVAILLSDQVMQGQAMHGVEICARARALRPDLVTMIITAYADDVAAAIDAINRGQVRAYLPKPWTEQLADVLEVTIARMHETKTARELGIDMLRAHPEQVKLTVLEQVAHDVLNPLNTARLHHARAKQLLQAAGERLGARGDGEIAAVLAGAAQHQSDSLAAMDQVVEVAARYRPEGPHRRPPTERCDVADVVASVVAYLRAEVERTATLSTAIESAPTVRMDRTALARVVANLLLNAAQAMAEKPGGAITVEVCAAKDRWWCVDDDVWYCNTCSGCCPGGCPP